MCGVRVNHDDTRPKHSFCFDEFALNGLLSRVERHSTAVDSVRAAGGGCCALRKRRPLAKKTRRAVAGEHDRPHPSTINSDYSSTWSSPVKPAPSSRRAIHQERAAPQLRRAPKVGRGTPARETWPVGAQLPRSSRLGQHVCHPWRRWRVAASTVDSMPPLSVHASPPLPTAPAAGVPALSAAAASATAPAAATDTADVAGFPAGKWWVFMRPTREHADGIPGPPPLPLSGSACGGSGSRLLPFTRPISTHDGLCLAGPGAAIAPPPKFPSVPQSAAAPLPP